MSTASNLSKEELGTHGCGMGTETACYALTMSPEGKMKCAEMCNIPLSYLAGSHLNWRVNLDKTDGKAWCPRKVLPNSKSQ